MPEAVVGEQLWQVVRKRWRSWLRAFHRDAGYCAIGLTIVYAVSGLAINHIQDWDPNFKSYQRERQIAPIPADVPDDVAVAQARSALGLGVPRSTYRAGDELHLELDGGRKVVVYGDSGLVIEQGSSERFLLRAANWLHAARGKPAWNYIADLYAVLLLYLAFSGLFMIKGKLGLRWRGAVLVTLGIAVPVTYVLVSGGPNAHKGKATPAAEAAAGALDGPPPAPDSAAVR